MDDAQMHADEIAYLGRVLTADPEFQRLLERHRSDQSNGGDDAVGAVCAFFRAITDTALPGGYRTNGQSH